MTSHSLSVRVFRAARPQYGLVEDPYMEHPPSQAVDFARSSHDPISPLLSLPSSFGELHLGERFAAIIVVGHDGTSEPAQTPMVLVELESPSRHKAILREDGEVKERLAAGECAEMMVECELKEAGQHALIVTVGYGIEGIEEQRTIRKLFRFNVTSCLSVRTKVHGVTSTIGQLSSRRETSYLEVQLSNTSITQSTMYFNRLHFDVNEALSVTAASDLQHFPLEAGSIRQHLAVLRPLEAAPSAAFAGGQASGALPLGRLDLGWRSHGGEPGRLQTSSLNRKFPPVSSLPAASLSHRDSQSRLQLEVLVAPATSPAGLPFVVRVRLRGGTDKARLEYERPPGPVAEQVASAVSSAAPESEEATLCLGIRQQADGEWETKWASLAGDGEVVDIGGLRAVEAGKVVQSWPVICQIWLVQSITL